VAAISSGSADIAAVPVNVSSTLYNKTSGNVQVLGVNTLGVLYILSNTEIDSIEDLRGKTIYSAGQGATPEFVLNKVLSENGIDPTTDVTINFLAEHTEVIAQAAAGTAEIVLLPEPNVTALLKKDIGFSIALDMTEEWGKVSNADLAMGCVIARKDFAEANPDVIADFLAEYAASVEFVNNDAAAAEAIAKYEIVPAAPVAAAAIPNCNIVLITGAEMQAIMEENLTVLHESNPAIIGGTLPSEDFYYIAE
ncbi:MAG: ABC transporter substrate-binding protein, partial [Clostridia bacterium]|nr:ABC transporter substrate-binding protein [Clostridia bacterium]